MSNLPQGGGEKEVKARVGSAAEAPGNRAPRAPPAGGRAASVAVMMSARPPAVAESRDAETQGSAAAALGKTVASEYMRNWPGGAAPGKTVASEYMRNWPGGA